MKVVREIIYFYMLFCQLYLFHYNLDFFTKFLWWVLFFLLLGKIIKVIYVAFCYVWYCTLPIIKSRIFGTMSLMCLSVAYLLNYLSLCLGGEGGRECEGSRTQRRNSGRGKESAFVYRSLRRTFRSLSMFTLRAIGPNQWASSISCQRGYAKILKNEASVCQMRSCDLRDGDIVLLPTSRRLRNKEHPISTSFRAFTSAVKFDTAMSCRFAFSLFSHDYTSLPKFCDEAQKCVQEKRSVDIYSVKLIQFRIVLYIVLFFISFFIFLLFLLRFIEIFS